VGWFAWRYHSWLNTDMIVKTYAQRVGGKAVEQKFEVKTKNIYYIFKRMHKLVIQEYFSTNSTIQMDSF
jgi:hypothetical protein